MGLDSVENHTLGKESGPDLKGDNSKYGNLLSRFF